MSIIGENTSKPGMISVNNMPPQTMKQRLVTHKIETDKDMLDFQAEMTEGRDILAIVPAPDFTYIMIREMVPSKVALG